MVKQKTAKLELGSRSVKNPIQVSFFTAFPCTQSVGTLLCVRDIKFKSFGPYGRVVPLFLIPILAWGDFSVACREPSEP